MRILTGLLAALSVSGCVAVVAPPEAPTAPAAVPPVARPATVPAATVNRVPDAPPAAPVVAPAATPAAVTPRASGPIDARTGLHQSAVVAVTGNATRGYSVLFRPAQTDSDKVAAAPAKLCGSAGVASSRNQPPRSGSAMPGVAVMVVTCGAA